MAIAVLVVWAFTAAAGLYLLRSVMAAEHAGTSSPVQAPVPDAGTTPGSAVPAPIPGAGASAPPGGHPLLEFCHPALGITGLACWFAFVATHGRAFAWIAVALLIVTIGAGLAWLASHTRSARQDAGGSSGPAVPVHRVLLHGLAAAATCALAVIAVLAAARG